MSPPWANIFHLDSKGLEVACGAAVVWQVRDLLVHKDQQPNLVCLLRPFGGESAVCVRVCESPIALCLYFRISHIPFLSLTALDSMYLKCLLAFVLVAYMMRSR